VVGPDLEELALADVAAAGVVAAQTMLLALAVTADTVLALIAAVVFAPPARASTCGAPAGVGAASAALWKLPSELSVAGAEEVMPPIVALAALST